MLSLIVLILPLVIAIPLVNWIFQAIATVLGGTLFYNVKVKLFAYFFAYMIFFGLLNSLFGVV